MSEFEKAVLEKLDVIGGLLAEILNDTAILDIERKEKMEGIEKEKLMYMRAEERGKRNRHFKRPGDLKMVDGKLCMVTPME